MIKYTTGNLLESDAQALVNAVNIVGVMGKGIALQFKKQYPENTRVYQKACNEGTIGIGKLLVVKDTSLYTGEKIIINFPTKTHWKNPSEYSYIEDGLVNLIEVIKQQGIKSIAIPALGAGNGGLEWEKVKQMLSQYLDAVDCEIYIYEPFDTILNTPTV